MPSGILSTPRQQQRVILTASDRAGWVRCSIVVAARGHRLAVVVRAADVS
jgi:hypothetical protein